MITLEYLNGKDKSHIDKVDKMYFYTEKQRSEFIDEISKLAYKSSFSFILDQLNNE